MKHEHLDGYRGERKMKKKPELTGQKKVLSVN